MSFTESLLVALLCMTIVMLALACLFILIKLFSFGINVITKKQTEKSKMILQAADSNTNRIAVNDFSSGNLKLYHVEERTAAMIMAIVSDESGIPLSELCFKSIKAIENRNDNEMEAKS